MTRQERYGLLKKIGMCPECGKRPASECALLCEECRARKNEWQHNTSADRYAAKKNAGICTRCGKSPARPGRVLCADCAEKENVGRRKSGPAKVYPHLTETPAGDLPKPKVFGKSNGSESANTARKAGAVRNPKPSEAGIEDDTHKRVSAKVPPFSELRSDAPNLTEQQKCATCKLPLDCCIGVPEKCYKRYVSKITKQ